MKKSDSTANNKVIILTSIGGGGHISATTAIEDYLHDDYDVQSINIFKDLLPHLDIFSFITFNKYSGEEIYNNFVPKKYFRLLKLFYYFGAWYINFQRKKIHVILRKYFIEQNPAIIISVIPIINSIVLNITEELNIPFILIPTDLDATMYLCNIINPTYKQFYIGLAFDNEYIMQSLQKALIPKEQIYIIGAPLRIEFFIKHDKFSLKQQYGVPENKPIIMIIMGARGSHDIEIYITKLLKIQKPIHIFACIGKNEKSKQQLEKIILPSHITMSIIGFTHHIADYMTMADILITKSGSQSVCEGFYKNIPLLLDAITALLPWEAFNHFFIKKYYLGEQIKTYNQIPSQITSLLNNSEKLALYKKNLEKLQKKNCKEELLKLLKK